MFKIKKKRERIELMIEFQVYFHEIFLEMRINVKPFDLYHVGTVTQICRPQNWDRGCDKCSWSYFQGHELNLRDRNGMRKHWNVEIVGWFVSMTDYVTSGEFPQIAAVHTGKNFRI